MSEWVTVRNRFCFRAREDEEETNLEFQIFWLESRWNDSSQGQFVHTQTVAFLTRHTSSFAPFIRSLRSFACSVHSLAQFIRLLRSFARTAHRALIPITRPVALRTQARLLTHLANSLFLNECVRAVNAITRFRKTRPTMHPLWINVVYEWMFLSATKHLYNWLCPWVG